MSLFEPRRSNPGTISGTLPATAYSRGKAMMVSAIDATTGARTFVIADGKCDGFLTRDSAAFADVRTDSQQLFPNSSLETPFEVSKEGTVDADILEFEAEGATFLKLSSTGALAADTAVGTPLSFDGGLLYIAQVGDHAQFELLKVMTPDVTDAIRVRVGRIQGYIVPPLDT